MAEGTTVQPRPPAPDWLAPAILSVLEDAYRRAGVFAGLPVGSLDHLVQAMTPLPGLTVEEMRRIAFEAENHIGPRLGVPEHPRSDEVRAAFRKRVNSVHPGDWDSPGVRFNRKVAQKHIGMLKESGDLPDEFKTSTDTGSMDISAVRRIGPILLRARMWAVYRPGPIIHSRLSFESVRDGTDYGSEGEIASIDPTWAVMDPNSAVISSEGDLEQRLRTLLRYARLALEAATSALTKTLH